MSQDSKPEMVSWPPVSRMKIFEDGSPRPCATGTTFGNKSELAMMNFGRQTDTR